MTKKNRLANSPNEARPLGTPKPAKKPKAERAAAKKAESAEKTENGSEEIVGGDDNRGSAEASNVVSFSRSETDSKNFQEKTKMSVTLSRVVKEGRKSKSIVFAGAGLRGTVRFPASSFATVPDSITIEAEGLSAGGGKPKMSKEERAALRASMTPEQKAAAAEERKAARIAKAKKLLGIA